MEIEAIKETDCWLFLKKEIERHILRIDIQIFYITISNWGTDLTNYVFDLKANKILKNDL